MAERLAEHGFRVEQAATGEEALERLNEFAFDILVTDLRLPGVDGRQVLDEAFARYPGDHRDRHHRIRHGARSRRGHAARRRRLHHQAVPVRGAAARAERGASKSGGCKAENAYLRAQLHDRFKHRRHHRPHAGHARAVRAAADGGRDVEHGADHRRDGHRQGAGGARDSRRAARAAISDSSRSTAARFRRRCSRPSSSVTCAARSPARSPTGRAASSRRIAARCSSTKSGR